ncbi:MAG: hypothetical protein M3024_08940, partial [Candidatus Dormibacteraeota bacterium]|nr:hypothetical protein [Candidatus Dormibacteraeota bacterium]
MTRPQLGPRLLVGLLLTSLGAIAALALAAPVAASFWIPAALLILTLELTERRRYALLAAALSAVAFAYIELAVAAQPVGAELPGA